jgi:hypothetical protein
MNNILFIKSINTQEGLHSLSGFQRSKSLCYDFKGLQSSKATVITVKFHVTLLAIYLSFEDVHERNCGNREKISPEVSLRQQ